MALLSTLMIGGGLMLMAPQMFPPLTDFWSKEAYDIWPSKILPPDVLVTLRHYEYITSAEFQQHMKYAGFDAEKSTEIFSSSESRLTTFEYLTAYHRGIITENEFDSYMQNLRYNKSDIEHFKKIGQFFPSPPDLIRFAVREVYSPAIRQRFLLDSDLPAEFITESKKAGLPEEQAKNYWASHWELPSASMGFEMMHRRVISEDDLSMLLKALDIMPFWREKIAQISYSPLTRVDVRRMFKLGVLDEDAVNNSYLDLGYNVDNARLMTEFTKKYESADMSDLSRTTIDKALKKGLITIDEHTDFMLMSGYLQSDIDFWQALLLFEIYESEKEAAIDNLSDLFVLGVLSIDEISLELNGMDLPSMYVEKILADMQKKTAKKIKVASKSDLESWLKLNIIDEKDYKGSMMMLGYSTKDIERYLTEINIEVDTGKVKYLPVATYTRWLTNEIITPARFTDIADAMGYSDFDIQTMISESEA